MGSLVEWLSAAATKVPKGKRGQEKKALQIQLLVRVLDRTLLQFTGTGISRSDKADNQSREFILSRV
jgi:hypothetical protein